ncbi:MAG: FAD-binding protein [Pseudomonadota bacterium]
MAEWKRETDVVVIGGGLAGYCAAIEAAQAGKIGIDPAALAATVRRYNDFVTRGVDEDFGRDGLSTYCGLTVDPQTRVLDVFGEPIAGLFAAGELMGGFHGVAYMTGSSLGKCVIFGRIAGRNATRVS